MKNIIPLLISMLLLLAGGCDFFSATRAVTLILERPSPWEQAAERDVWYHLRWVDPVYGVRERYVPAGTVEITLQVSKGVGFVAAAYPAAIGTPVGGSGNSAIVQLSYKHGAAADAVLQAEKFQPGCCSLINFPAFSELLTERGVGDPWRIGKTELYYSLIQQNLSGDSLIPLQVYSVTFHDLPEGYWISDTPMRPGFFVHDSGHVTVPGFYRGTFRYLLPEEELMLTIIGQNEEAYWYVSRVLPEYFSLTRQKISISGCK